MCPRSPEEWGDPPVSVSLADAVARSVTRLPTDPRTRSELMDLLACPRPPIDRSAYAWTEVGPGLRLHVVSQDAGGRVKRCLVWGKPGAHTPRHDHGGDEVILVLEGRLRDDRGSYGPGDICRAKPGDVHEEHVQGPEDCLCFVLYYGELIPVA